MDDMDLPNGFTCGDCANWRKCTALIESIEPASTACDWSPSRFALNLDKYISLRAQVASLTAALAEAQVTRTAYDEMSSQMEDAQRLWTALRERCIKAEADRASLTAELAAAREAQRWIPVGERLPEEDDEVICMTTRANRHTRCIRTFYRDGEFYTPWSSDIVTHWMPLPPAPEVSNE